VKTSFTSVKLKVGQKQKIEATVVMENPKKQGLVHAKTLRYASGNPRVATVSSKGKITAVAPGTCYVYVYAENGVSRKIKVKVR